MWVVYIVECADCSLYTGITNDLAQRMAAHETGKGAKYTKHRGPLILRYTETLDSKGAALRREAAIKSLDRTAKLHLISAYKETGSLP
jgi:putative endonuclease